MSTLVESTIIRMLRAPLQCFAGNSSRDMAKDKRLFPRFRTRPDAQRDVALNILEWMKSLRSMRIPHVVALLSWPQLTRLLSFT